MIKNAKEEYQMWLDNVHDAEGFDLLSFTYTPKWMTKELCDQHKKRLYTKAPEYYKNFEKTWYQHHGGGSANDERYRVFHGKSA